MATSLYRIRFHGRGGQGMKTASRILGSAFFGAGFEVQDAPRYGAERRGAPIAAYVRASHTRIDERGIIRSPDLVVVADDSLVPMPSAGVVAGLGSGGVLLIASQDGPEVWRQRLRLDSHILALPALADVLEGTRQAFVGAACAGAAARLVGVVGRAALATAVADELAALGPGVVEKNRALALAAFDGMADRAGLVTPGMPTGASAWTPPEWVDLPVEDAGISAPVIRAALTSQLQMTGAWRTHRPVIDVGRCHRCWWVCSTFCPDGAIGVDSDGLPRIDYDHCKGCLICVAQCPAHVIAAVPECMGATASAGGVS